MALASKDLTTAACSNEEIYAKLIEIIDMIAIIEMIDIIVLQLEQEHPYCTLKLQAILL